MGVGASLYTRRGHKGYLPDGAARKGTPALPEAGPLASFTT